MHLYSKFRLSCSVALLSMWLAAVSLSACANTVLVGEACAAACEDDHSEGLESYQSVSNPCACTACSEACKHSVCDDHQTPSDACLPCVQASLRDDECSNEGFFELVCLTKNDCIAFIDCLMACPP